MRSAAKQQFRQSRPSSCVYCGSLIKSDMYRRDYIWTWPSCGGAQCRGAPSGRARLKTVWITCVDLTMFRGRSSRPAWRSFFPPWTVSRNVWSDALSAQHSGISTDVLLFSDIHLSLVHHYRVHKRCHCQWACRQLGWCRQTLPVPGCCVWVILRKFSMDQLGRRDVLIGREDQCAWRSRLL